MKLHVKFDFICSEKSMFYLQGRTDLQAIQIIKRLGNNMSDSYLEEGKLEEDKILKFVYLRFSFGKTYWYEYAKTY